MAQITVNGQIVSEPCGRCGDLACAAYQVRTGAGCHHGIREPAAVLVPPSARPVRKIVPSSAKGSRS